MWVLPERRLSEGFVVDAANESEELFVVFAHLVESVETCNLCALVVDPLKSPVLVSEPILHSSHRIRLF